MTVDIISFTSEQYARLSEEQLLQVRSAQAKKNRLDNELAAAKEAEKYRLIKNGVFLSEIWERYCAKLQREYEQELESLRQGLLFYLQYSKGSAADVPYEVDYDSTVAERFEVVKTYYETAYADGTERFEAFKADEFAVGYLGEGYAALYDYLLEQSE